MPIAYTYQYKQLGLADAILQAESHIGGDFVLMLGDNVFRGNLGDVISRRQKGCGDAVFLVEKVSYEEAVLLRRPRYERVRQGRRSR